MEVRSSYCFRLNFGQPVIVFIRFDNLSSPCRDNIYFAASVLFDDSFSRDDVFWRVIQCVLHERLIQLLATSRVIGMGLPSSSNISHIGRC